MSNVLFVLLRLLSVLHAIAVPLHLAETHIFCMLRLHTWTSFRMFPPADIAPEPDYTLLAYASAMINIMLIRYYVAGERRLDGRATLGKILRPLTSRAGPFVEYLVMFARVWLAVAWINMTMVQWMTDLNAWKLAVKLAWTVFLL